VPRPTRMLAMKLPSARPLGGCLWGCFAISTSCVLSRLVASYALPFDLIANLSYFAVVPLFAVAFAASAIRWWSLSAVAAVVALVAATPVIRAVAWVSPSSSEETPVASVLFCNIHGNVAAIAPLLKIVEREQPDVVAIVEAEPLVVERLLATPELNSRFPFWVVPRLGLQWSQVVLSRYRIDPIKMPDADRRYRGLFTFHRANVINLPIGRVIFSAEHVPSPRTTRAWRDGNDRITLLGEVVREHFSALDLPVIIAGDFNSTPAGHRHRLLMTVSGLHPDPIGMYSWGTWPSRVPGWIRLPLDRVWGTPDVRFLARRILEDVGSDHRPIIVTFRLAAAPCAK
jgi:endonuclease/exonuclease/phosphatase (EEP) superfamily protein YafD